MIHMLSAHLFPSPAEISEKKGLFNKPKSLSVHFQNSSFESLIPVSPIPLNKVGKSSADLIFIQTDLGHKEAYKIE